PAGAGAARVPRHPEDHAPPGGHPNPPLDARAEWGGRHGLHPESNWPVTADRLQTAAPAAQPLGAVPQRPLLDLAAGPPRLQHLDHEPPLRPRSAAHADAPL